MNAPASLLRPAAALAMSAIAAATVTVTAGPAGAAPAACTPTTTLAPPSTTLTEGGFVLPSDWVTSFLAAQGSLPGTVAQGQHRTLDGQVTVHLSRSGSSDDVTKTYGGAGAVSDLTDFAWRPGSGSTTILGFTAERLPYADTLDGARQVAIDQARDEAGPDAAYLGYEYAESFSDHYLAPLTYWNGCRDQTVNVDVTTSGTGAGASEL